MSVLVRGEIVNRNQNRVVSQFGLTDIPVEPTFRPALPFRMMVAMAQSLSHGHMIIAWTIFLASYFVFAVGRLPGTKIDRPAMAVIGAVLMFVFGVLAPAQAIASIDFATLVLLFSMMLIVASLHLAGFFQWVSHLVIEHLPPRHLLPGVIFTSGILSAFLCTVSGPVHNSRRSRASRNYA
jgi:di/tricarboxylate transporter